MADVEWDIERKRLLQRFEDAEVFCSFEYKGRNYDVKKVGSYSNGDDMFEMVAHGSRWVTNYSDMTSIIKEHEEMYPEYFK
jgi:hypothetical protein